MTNDPLPMGGTGGGDIDFDSINTTFRIVSPGYTAMISLIRNISDACGIVLKREGGRGGGDGGWVDGSITFSLR